VVHVSPLAGTSVPPLSNASLDYLPETIQEPSGDDSDYYQAESWNDRLHNGGTVYQRFGVPSDNSPFKIHNRKPEDLPPYQLEDIDIGTENPDSLLSVFRDEMHPNFPFIVIPDSVQRCTQQSWQLPHETLNSSERLDSSLCDRLQRD